ncbi:hypothetical protein [uncultured Polaribacter sp.]|uniref:hypothetical protein n=1 Tax=uncultured Polaribacter sp. TaxID=174711 RepID=UPI002633B07B|nr:hypothetical protein [uncultured Polaribacter sp.]
MTVDVLSSIKGAKESEAVSKLFDVIKSTNATTANTVSRNAVSLNNLREDVVVHSPQAEKDIIIENFPREKNGYLVVAKVIEE